MKMKSFFKMGVLLAAISLTITGCHKDDKTPEQLPDPLETTNEYYLVGVISSADGAVKNAEVKISDAIKANTNEKGQYNLTLDKTGDYTVTVSASKLESFSTKVTIASSAQNRSTLTLNVTLGKAVEYTAPETAVSGQETKLTVPDATEAGATEAIVTAPADGVEAGVKISAGAYEETKSFVSGSVTAGTTEENIALSNIAVRTEPANAPAKEDITITTPNPSADNTIHFDTDYMVAQKDASVSTRAWEDMGASVTYNDGNYQIVIPKGSTIAGRYATRIKVDKTTSRETAGEANLANGEETVTKDNSGNLAGIKDFEIKVAIKSGWEYTTSPADAVKAAVGVEDAGLAAAIKKQIEATEGTPGIYTVERTLKTNISGNSILYYQNRAKFCTKTYTFKIVVKGNKNISVNVVLKCYTGSEERYTNQSADEHSGGGTGTL